MLRQRSTGVSTSSPTLLTKLLFGERTFDFLSMPTVGHLSAWIQVDGVRLPEYATEIDPSGTKASCWVPSEAGKVSHPSSFSQN